MEHLMKWVISKNIIFLIDNLITFKNIFLFKLFKLGYAYGTLLK